MSLRWTLPDVMHSGISQYDQIGRNKSHVEKKSRHTQAQHLTTFQATPVSKLPHFPQVASKLEPRSLEGPQTVRDSQPNHHSHKSRVPFKPLRKISIPVQKRSIHDTVLSRGPSTSFRFLPQTSIKSDNAKQRIGKTAKRNLNGPEDGVEVARAPSGRSKQLTLQRVDPINIKHSNHPLVPQTTPNGLFIRGYSPGQRKHPVPPFYYVPPTFSQPSSSIPATKIPFFMGHHMQPSSKPEMIQSARRSSSAYQQSQYSPCTEWSSLIPLAKDWSEVSLAVYRVGVGMYHSSLVCDLIEWHFWQGYGVEARRRYYDDDCQQLVSVDHLPFVTLVPIETLMVPPRQIASLCVELATRQFSCHTYDIIKCNCNHFTAEVLRRLGLSAKFPGWVNRLAVTADSVCNKLPFVRNWIDALLNRPSIINRDAPQDSEKETEHASLENHDSRPEDNLFKTYASTISRVSTAAPSLNEFSPLNNHSITMAVNSSRTHNDDIMTWKE